MGILDVISKGEDYSTEFKARLSEKREILETICAFSNSNGGTILIGVSDNGEILGVDIGRSTIEELINDIKFSIEPTIIPHVELVEIEGKKIIVIRVAEGLNKPYFFKGVAFRRIGKTNQRIPRDELEKIIVEKYKNLISFEERVFNVGIDEFNEIKVKDFTLEVKVARKIDLTYSTLPEFFQRLGLLNENKPTSVAILCFSKSPQMYFPFAFVKCGRVKDGIADEKEITGTLLDQVHGTLEFLKNNITLSHTVSENGKRIEHWEIPIEVLREAVVNAIVHRDYEITSPIYVKVFDDRIEIINPGKLLSPLTPEKLKKEHPSILRNPKIANIFFLYGFVERWGYGTNKIVELCIRNGLREPDFVEEESFFKVILYRKSLNEMEKLVLQFVKEGVNTSSKIAKKLKINERTARKYLSSLVSKGLLSKRRIGRRVEYY
jgi:ATP-dependent DNA helicase RecG